jgi:phage terminase large subunit-like protein
LAQVATVSQSRENSSQRQNAQSLGVMSHGSPPVLRWTTGNVSKETAGEDSWKSTKKKPIERIFGIVALIIGLNQATTLPAAELSIYFIEHRGFTEIG